MSVPGRDARPTPPVAVTYSGLPISSGGAHSLGRISRRDAYERTMAFLRTCTEPVGEPAHWLGINEVPQLKRNADLERALERRFGRRERTLWLRRDQLDIRPGQVADALDFLDEIDPQPTNQWGMAALWFWTTASFRILDPDTGRPLPGQDPVRFGMVDNQWGHALGVSDLRLILNNRAQLGIDLFIPDADEDVLRRVVPWLQRHLPCKLSAKHWLAWTPTRTGTFKARRLVLPFDLRAPDSRASADRSGTPPPPAEHASDPGRGGEVTARRAGEQGAGVGDTRLESLRNAVRAAPEEPSLHALLGGALLASGLLDEAVDELKTALSLDPGQAQPKLELAEAHRRKGDLEAARRIAQELLRDVGDSAELLILLARIQLAQGYLDAARETYRQAVSADPRATDASLQEALVESAEDGPADAEPLPQDGPARRVMETSDYGLERPAISFKDVGGMDALKEEIRLKLVYPMTHPELYASYGQRAGGGILMYGPPGCGKTYLARATAGEVNAAFLAIGLHDILDMWIGQSERNLHEVFELARANSPCVLFFDEVDALGASRSDMRTSAGRHVINQFLSELDGAAGDNEGILILGATNVPWHLDSAFRRPGRFDEIIFVPPPDDAARAEILRALLQHRPASDVDVEAVARRTAGLSGADLKGVVDRATASKLREAIRSGRQEPLRTQDLTDAAKDTPPSTKDWFLTARNYVLYSNESGLYDPVRPYLAR